MEVKGQPYTRIFIQHFQIILQNPAPAFAETGFLYSLSEADKYLLRYFGTLEGTRTPDLLVRSSADLG